MYMHQLLLMYKIYMACDFCNFIVDVDLFQNTVKGSIGFAIMAVLFEKGAEFLTK